MERKKIKIKLSDSDLGQCQLLSYPNGRHSYRTSVLAKIEFGKWQTSVPAKIEIGHFRKKIQS